MAGARERRHEDVRAARWRTAALDIRVVSGPSLLSVSYCAAARSFGNSRLVVHSGSAASNSPSRWCWLAAASALSLLKFMRLRERALAKYFAKEDGGESAASASASASAHPAGASPDADLATSGGGGGDGGGALQAEEEPAAASGSVSSSMSIAQTEEMQLDEMCAEVRAALKFPRGTFVSLTPPDRQPARRRVHAESACAAPRSAAPSEVRRVDTVEALVATACWDAPF